MFLFLLTAVPIAYLLLLNVTRQVNQPLAFTLIAFIKGMLAFLPVLVVVMALDYAIPYQFNAGPLYLRYTLLPIGMPLAAVTLGALILIRGVVRSDLGGAVTAALSFLCGFYTVAGVVDTVANIGQTDPYVLFLLPVTRLVMVLLLPFLFVTLYRGVGVWRLANALAIAAMPFVLGSVPLLYRVGFREWAIAAAAGLFFASAVMYVRFVLGRLPVGRGS